MVVGVLYRQLGSDTNVSIWDDIGGVFTAPATAIQGVDDFVKFAAWIFSPLSWLRMVEFLAGFILMLTGMWALIGNRSPTLASTGAGIARVTRNVAEATPAGRVARERRGRRMGSREGQREAARMQARREATRTEREASARERADRERRARQQARTGERSRRPSHV